MKNIAGVKFTILVMVVALSYWFFFGYQALNLDHSIYLERYIDGISIPNVLLMDSRMDFIYLLYLLFACLLIKKLVSRYVDLTWQVILFGLLNIGLIATLLFESISGYTLLVYVYSVKTAYLVTYRMCLINFFFGLYFLLFAILRPLYKFHVHRDVDGHMELMLKFSEYISKISKANKSAKRNSASLR